MRRMLLSLLVLVAVSVPAMGNNLDGLAGTYSFTIGELGSSSADSQSENTGLVDMLGVFELSGDGLITGSRTYFGVTGSVSGVPDAVEQTFVGSYSFNPDGIGVASITVSPAFPPISSASGIGIWRLTTLPADHFTTSRSGAGS